MKPSRQYICEACDEAASLPADLETIPRCANCGRDSLVLVLKAPDADAPVTPERAANLFREMRKQIIADESDPKPSLSQMARGGFFWCSVCHSAQSPVEETIGDAFMKCSGCGQTNCLAWNPLALPNQLTISKPPPRPATEAVMR